MASKQEQLHELIAPLVASLECQLWGLEYLTQGRYTTLRIYIEREPDGATLEDCERVSRHVSSLLDVEDPIGNRYTLEVSSPGMDRLLFTPAQYALYVGETLAIKTRFALDGRRKFKGVLQSVGDDALVLVVDGQEQKLTFSGIEKAHLVPNF